MSKDSRYREEKVREADQKDLLKYPTSCRVDILWFLQHEEGTVLSLWLPLLRRGRQRMEPQLAVGSWIPQSPGSNRVSRENGPFVRKELAGAGIARAGEQ